MEKRDAFLLLVLSGASGYGVYANWATLRVKLGLDDMHPGRIKALQLAKDANTFEPYSVNSVVLRDRASNGEINLQGEPWSATEIQKPRYRVTCTFLEKGERKVHCFTVDIAAGGVTYEGLDDSKPAPR